MTFAFDLLGERAVTTLFLTFLHFLWQGALVAGVAWLGLAILRRSEPRVRYAWAVAALALLVALPALTAIMVNDSSVARPSAAIDRPEPVEMPPAIPDIDPNRAPVTTVSDPGSPASGKPSHGALRVEPAAPWIVMAWLLGAVALLARHLGGLVHLRRGIVRSATPVEGSWSRVLRELAARLGVRRPVRLLRSERVPSPLVAGWLRPVVVVPASLFTGMPAGDLEALLAHELAHVRRHDYLVNLLQIAAESALFFHPAVWWLSSRIREEREHCCDDLAAEAIGDRLRYVRALAHLAGEPSPHRLVAASGGSLLARIRRLAGVERHELLPSAWTAAAVMLSIPLSILVGLWAPMSIDASAIPGLDSRNGLAEAEIAASADRIARTEPLTVRWADALGEVGTSGGWIAWGLAPSSEGSTVISGSPGGPPDRDDAPATGSYLSGLSVSERPDVVLLFGFQPGDRAGDAVRHVRLRDLDMPLDLGGMPLHWLGNAEDQESVALLERLLAANGDAAVRAEMAAALTLHADPRVAVPAVARVLADDPSARVRSEALQWVGRHAGPEVEGLTRRALLTDPSPTVRQAAAGTMDEPGGDPEAEAALLTAVFEDSDPAVRADAFDALAERGTSAAWTGLRRIAREHPEAGLRSDAADALAEGAD